MNDSVIIPRALADTVMEILDQCCHHAEDMDVRDSLRAALSTPDAEPVAWMNAKEHPFPEATMKEYRYILIKTHNCLTLVAHCAWDHSGEYQPQFGPDWYCSTYKGDPKLLDISSVYKWMPIPKDMYYTHPMRELSDDEILIVADQYPYGGPTEQEMNRTICRFANAIIDKSRKG